MKIYTKVGDGGLTVLNGGSRVKKSAPRVEAFGTVDELNGWLGLALTDIRHKKVKDAVIRVQSDLFVLGAHLSTPPAKRCSGDIPAIEQRHINDLERAIDKIDALLPPLKNFILPGGTPGGAALHMARAVCRRAERAVVRLLPLDPELLIPQIYLNRLSDYLFILARQTNWLSRKTDTPWRFMLSGKQHRALGS